MQGTVDSRKDAPADPTAFDDGAVRWRDAVLAAALLAIDPTGLGGARLRCAPGWSRECWIDLLRSNLPGRAPFVKLPVGADTDRILGGLNLAATLREGRPVSQRGVLAAADNGVLLVAMAERLAPATAAFVAAAMDDGCVRAERNGVSRSDPARLCAILLDEGADAFETPPQILLERVAFHLDLDAVSVRDASAGAGAGDLARARADFASTTTPDAIAEAIAEAGAALGVASLRALHFALRAARACAALRGAGAVSRDDAETACRLVFGPRARIMAAPPDQPDAPERKADQTTHDDDPGDASQDDVDRFDEMLVEAARAAALRWQFAKPGETRRRGAAGAGGKSGALVESLSKGRPAGALARTPGDGARLDLPATLRAAAPWQKMRHTDDRNAHLTIYKDDLRVKRFKARSETVVIFVVDASGSSAMHRMGEAKGAVELLLSDCYSRRDHVCLIAFRGDKADLLLPPTRSLTRVRRTLAALPGGGGTPLAAGLASAAALVDAETRRGRTPYVVILSDGRGNIALNGDPDREAAQSDALAAARRLRQSGAVTLFFDTGRRPGPQALSLSETMGAHYAPLPFADSARVSRSVKQAIAAN